MGGASELAREKGNAAYRREQWHEAIQWYTEAISETNDDVRPLGNRSACYAMVGKYAEALRDANTGLGMRPRWVKGWSRKGLAHFYLGQYAEAKAAYEQGLALEPGNSSLKAGLAQVEGVLGSGATEKERGGAAFKRGDFARAERHYTAALAEEADPNSDAAAVLLSNRSACFAKLNRAKEALADAQAAIRIRPKWPKAYTRRAAAHHLQGKFDAARADYEKAMELDPNDMSLVQGMKALNVGADSTEAKAKGDEAFKAGRYDEAASCYSTAIQAHPRDEKLWSNRSACYAKLLRWKEALADAKQTLALRPDWARAWSRVGAAMHGVRDLETAYIYYCKGILKCPGASELVQARWALLGDLCKWDSILASARENRWYAKDALMPSDKTRIFVCSDIHVDQHGNISWCQKMNPSEFINDVLLVAGDCGDTMNAIKQGLRALKQKFRRVFFIPGNHDLWIRPGIEDSEYPDSICKLMAMLNVFDEIGVEMGPAEVARGLFVVPLYSWYNHQFDEGDPNPGGLRYDKFCRWPMDDMGVWEYMLRMNSQRVRKYKRGPDDKVFSFSHFLPRAELPAPWGVTEMAKNVGCKELDLQVERVEADVHAYGHTHMNGDGECGARYVKDAKGMLSPVGARNYTRYIQNALEGGGRGLYCVWDKGLMAGHSVDAH